MRIAFLVANEGVEQVELTEPWQAVRDGGGEPVLVAPQPGGVQAFHHLTAADTFPVDLTVDKASVTEFDGLVLPGGVANPDALRVDHEAIAFIKAFRDLGKPIAAICHAPWTLIEADVVRNRTLTSWPSLKTDIRNAGGSWIDTEVMVDSDGPNPLVTSRNPHDLPAFCAAALQEFKAQVGTAA